MEGEREELVVWIDALLELCWCYSCVLSVAGVACADVASVSRVADSRRVVRMMSLVQQ
jgi:hypothetical protein